jgi:hypothetical protein
MRLPNAINILALGITVFVITGCASIVDGRARKISVKSEPDDAKVTVYDQTGNAVISQQTPAVFRLQRSEGYFKGASYRLVIEKPGYEKFEVALRPRLDGWYFGNVIFGGLIGIVIVDPMTGAMWTLSPRKVDVPLKQHVAGIHMENGSMIVMLRKDVPAELVPRLVPVSTK